MPELLMKRSLRTFPFLMQLIKLPKNRIVYSIHCITQMQKRLGLLLYYNFGRLYCSHIFIEEQKMFARVIFFLAVATLTNAFPSGAPTSTCSSMTPSHSGSPITQIPFTVSAVVTSSNRVLRESMRYCNDCT